MKDDFQLASKLFFHAMRMFSLAMAMRERMPGDRGVRAMTEWANEWREELVKLMKPMKLLDGYKDTWSPFDGVAFVHGCLRHYAGSVSAKERGELLVAADALLDGYGKNTQAYIMDKSDKVPKRLSARKAK